MTYHGEPAPWHIIIRQAKAPWNAKRHTFIPAATTQTFCCSFFQFGFLLGAASIYPLIDPEIANIDYVELNYQCWGSEARGALLREHVMAAPMTTCAGQ